MANHDGQQQKPTQIKVLECKSVYSGKNAKGDDYTIYEVKACKPSGEPINQKLRSFTELSVGEIVEVFVKLHKSDKYEDSYTLTPKKASARQVESSVKELEGQLDSLKRSFEALQARVAKLEQGAPAQAASQAAPSSPDPDDPFAEPTPAAAGSQFGDDPPF